MRDSIQKARIVSDPHFRWRGGEISRLEALSDGVFAVTFTLIIASLDAPNTFSELWQTAIRLPVFALCFAVFLYIWHIHYLYFRRYGIDDRFTMVLNGAYLLLVVCYAYPLKFLLQFLWLTVLGQDQSAMFAITPGVFDSVKAQRAGMLFYYNLGFVALFTVATLMFAHAMRHRKSLNLDPLEIELTRISLRSYAINVGFGLVSLVILLTGVQPGFAGIPYLFLIPTQLAHSAYSKYRVKHLISGA